MFPLRLYAHISGFSLIKMQNPEVKGNIHLSLPFELIRCDLEPISTRVLNLVLESPGIQAAWAALLSGKRMFAKL